MDIKIAKVTHYYDKIGVAVIDVVKQPLKVGDVIKISGHDSEFNQAVSSLQIEHAQVKEIAAKESGALKTDKPVKEGDVIYLVTKKLTRNYRPAASWCDCDREGGRYSFCRMPTMYGRFRKVKLASGRILNWLHAAKFRKR
jgi:hypothetical protein